MSWCYGSRLTTKVSCKQLTYTKTPNNPIWPRGELFSNCWVLVYQGLSLLSTLKGCSNVPAYQAKSLWIQEDGREIMRIIALVTPIANILIGQSCQPIKDKRFCNTQNFNFEIDLTIVFVTSTFGGVAVFGTPAISCSLIFQWMRIMMIYITLMSSEFNQNKD